MSKKTVKLITKEKFNDIIGDDNKLIKDSIIDELVYLYTLSSYDSTEFDGEIKINDDLNDFTTPGKYVMNISGGGYSGNIKNSPMSLNTYIMTVKKLFTLNNTSHYQQILLDRTGRLCFRSFYKEEGDDYKFDKWFCHLSDDKYNLNPYQNVVIDFDTCGYGIFSYDGTSLNSPNSSNASSYGQGVFISTNATQVSISHYGTDICMRSHNGKSWGNWVNLTKWLIMPDDFNDVKCTGQCIYSYGFCIDLTTVSNIKITKCELFCDKDNKWHDVSEFIWNNGYASHAAFGHKDYLLDYLKFSDLVDVGKSYLCKISGVVE